MVWRKNKSVVLLLIISIVLLSFASQPIKTSSADSKREIRWQDDFSMTTSQARNDLLKGSLTPVKVSGLTYVKAIAAGNGGQNGNLVNSAAYALVSDGKVWSWGNNGYGQLGNNSIVDSSVPVQVSGLTGISAISAGYEAGYALKSDGTVWAWGNNQSGQLGVNAVAISEIPVQVSRLNNVIAIAGGYKAAYALKSDGTVWAWGDNTYGQLGRAFVITSHVPVKISSLDHITNIITAGRTAYALKSDGTVWTWGERPPNLSWDGKTSGYKPMQISGLAGVDAIAAGGSTGYALKSDGTVWAWGWDGEGEFGSTSIHKKQSVQIQGLSHIVAIAARNDGGYGINNSGEVWAWGGLFGGNLGNNSRNGSAVPVQLSDLTNVKTIVSADYDSYALKDDGTVWAWGGNRTGQLGNGNKKAKSKETTQTNPLFDTSLLLPNGQVVIPDQLVGKTVINHSVRWKDLLISLQISSPGGILGNHSTVLSHTKVSTSAGIGTLILNERTPPAAAESTTPTYEYWVILNRSQYAYAIEATVIGNLDKAKNEVVELLNSWKVPQ
jgi:alpha-tubulin suppressor-like RCC1 family protein